MVVVVVVVVVNISLDVKGIFLKSSRIAALNLYSQEHHTAEHYMLI